MQYEYRCSACQHEFELEQKLTDKKRIRCPKCRKHKLVRLISLGNFILRGSGWCRDGYGK